VGVVTVFVGVGITFRKQMPALGQKRTWPSAITMSVLRPKPALNLEDYQEEC
jgi:hypothetical protein